MEFMESRLLGIQVDEAGCDVVLSVIDATGTKFALELHGVERLLVNELRQQNVIEAMTHWARGEPTVELREAAFILMTGATENDCGSQLAAAAYKVVDRVSTGELEMMAITAVFGAQVLASFASMTVRPAA